MQRAFNHFSQLCKPFSFSCIRNYKKGPEPPPPYVKNISGIIQWNDCLPFVPPIYGGQVIKVYDGDTITIASKLPYTDSPLYRFSVRLNGIDAPEIKGKTEEEKKSAQLARNALESLVLHKYVILKNTTTEKYGRILADVYLITEKNEKNEKETMIHLNQWLLDNKYAVEYDGGTKHPPESWAKYNAEK